MFDQSPDMVINSLRTYALSHGGMCIKSRLDKTYEKVVIKADSVNSLPEPKLVIKDSTHTIGCKNHFFESIDDEPTAYFAFHFILGLKMEADVVKRLKSLLTMCRSD